MEGLTRLVTESLARHGFDRPLDYRRLQWSRWFRCESHHSLLSVPSKPGVFAVAEEIMDIPIHGAADALVRPPEPTTNREGHDFSRAVSAERDSPALAAEGITDGNGRAEAARRMLAVTQFFEDDDMAFVLDRMLSRQNVMSSRLASGRYFVRFVVVEDQTQRRSICAALNQWILSATEKATGIASEFATSLELTPATEYTPQPDDRQANLFADLGSQVQAHDLLDDPKTHREGHDFSRANRAAQTSPALAAEENVARVPAPATTLSMTAPQLDSGAATNIHCPSPLPSGF